MYERTSLFFPEISENVPGNMVRGREEKIGKRGSTSADTLRYFLIDRSALNPTRPKAPPLPAA